jgi:hypothetical protein
VILYAYTALVVEVVVQVKVIMLRERGVERDRSTLNYLPVQRGMLVIMDVSDQGLRRPAKVARLLQGTDIRHELTDVHIVWCNEGRFTLAGFERHKNTDGKPVDYAQSWLCSLDFETLPDLSLSKQRNVRPAM